VHRSDIFYLYARYTQIYFLGSIIFTRHYARSYRQVVGLAFFHVFLFSLREKSNTSLMYLEISAWWSSTTKNFNILNLFRLKHGSLSSTRQQRWSIIHQWTMFGTDCSRPQLATSVSLFIQFSLVMHLFLFSLILFKMYTFSRWTYFPRYYPIMYCHKFQNLFEKIPRYNKIYIISW